MVFKTKPGQNPDTVIVDRNTRKKLGAFKDGRFDTADQKLISRLKPHYDVVEEEVKRRARRGKEG